MCPGWHRAATTTFGATPNGEALGFGARNGISMTVEPVAPVAPGDENAAVTILPKEPNPIFGHLEGVGEKVFSEEAKL
jgi:hypothetical protein